jgi:tetratricopeptide (TPR) repeat protein
MSPEQALGRRVVVDGRTDVYSLGVTLYELLTLRPAVDGRDQAEVLRRIAEQEPTPLRALNPAVPRDLDTIIAKAMEKDPAARYATARDLAGDLQSYLEDRPIRARRPNLADRAWRWGRRHRTLAWSAATTVLVVVLMLAGGIGYVVRDRAARLAQTGQRVAESLAGARTAIVAGDLALASQRAAEAQGRLGADGASLPGPAAEIGGIRREIDTRQADAARFSQFLKEASDAQDSMSYGDGTSGDRLGEKALGLYGVLTEKDWLSRLETSYLTAGQKQQVRETAYVTLVSLADFAVRWKPLREAPGSVARSLDLLQRAESFHRPTRAFYFVRAQCWRRQGNTAAATEEEKQFKVAAAQTAWDYYLPGHTAGWGGDLDEAIRSYQAALAMQPNHYNSLYFLAARLASDKINRRPEAIAYATGCIALRPDHEWAYITRGECRLKIGQMEAAKADFEAALTAAKTDPNRGGALKKLAELMLEKGHDQEAQELFARVVEVARRVRWEEHDSLRLYAAAGLADLYTVRGEFSKAEPIWLEALEVCRRMRGEEHSDTLLTMKQLAWTYKQQGKVDQAEPLLVHVLDSRRRVLGGEHRDTLLVMNELACTYANQGKFAEAEPLLVKALDVSRRVSGEEHRDSLTYMQNLARLYQEQGKLAQAGPLLVQALEVGGRVLGEQDRYTIGAMDDLAWLYAARCEYSKAESFWGKALDVSRRVLGDEDPVTIKYMCNFVFYYRNAGRLPEATDLLERSRAKALKRPEYPVENLAWISSQLSTAYEQAGQFAKAESVCRETLETVRQRHKEALPQSTVLQISLAASLLKQRRYAEAEPLLRDGLKFREQNEPDGWTTFNAKSLLGGSLLGQKEYDEAEPLLLAGYQGMKQREGKIPPFAKVRLTEAVERLVQLYVAWGRIEKAAEWRAKLPPAAAELPDDVFARP